MPESAMLRFAAAMLLIATWATFPGLVACTAATPVAHAPPAPPQADVRADAARKPDRALVNTYWKLVALAGAPVVVTPNQREPHLVLHVDGERVTGSTGCNRLTGRYALRGDGVTFGKTATTEMACLDGMEQEAAFLAALARVSRWRTRGDELVLLEGADAEVLRFVAVDLR
jgi:heat shock protein HslJ